MTDMPEGTNSSPLAFYKAGDAVIQWVNSEKEVFRMQTYSYGKILGNKSNYML